MMRGFLPISWLRVSRWLMAAILSASSAFANGQTRGFQLPDWKNPTVEQFDLKGPVRHFEKKRVDALPDGSIDPASRGILQECTFDNKGRAVECRNYSFEKKNSLLSRVIYRYDSLGRTAGMDTYEGIGNPSRVDYMLDEKGRRSERRMVQTNGEPGGRMTWKYDAAGNVIEEDSFAWNSQVGDPPDSRTLYEYDSAGHVLNTKYFDRYAKSSWELRNKIDHGHIVESETYYGGELGMRQTWEYDDKDRKTGESTVFFNENAIGFHGPQPGRATWKYDDSNHLVEETYFDRSGAVDRTARFSFDEHGKQTGADAYVREGGLFGPIGTIEVNGLKTIMTWSNGAPTVIYEYDEHGNWVRAIHTQRSQFKLDSPRITSFIEERTIEYYQ